MMSAVGMFATAGRRSECPLVGADRKWTAHGQNGANDPGSENVREQRMRRIVFSFFLFRRLQPALFFS
jgi:hypothetical protein